MTRLVRQIDGRGRSMWPMTVRLRRPRRVTCELCRASHPAIYEGQACLICGTTIEGATRHREDAGAFDDSKRRNTKELEQEYEAKIAALRSERDELRSALEALQTRQGSIGTPDYEWHVELAAKGLAQRDSYPMPPSITEPKEFYEIMAGAALDATGLPFLLERAVRAERSLEVIQDALRQADVNVQNARHLAMTDPSATIADVEPAEEAAPPAPKLNFRTDAQFSKEIVTKRKRRVSGVFRDAVSGLRLRSAQRSGPPARPNL